MDNKLIDLHTHTCYSDGELTPNALLNEAIKQNVGIISITDHDTVQGLKNVSISDYDTLKLIPGIELSAKVKSGQMHILGYSIDINNKSLNAKLLELQDNSLNSVLAILVQIRKDYGISFTTQEIRDLVNANHKLGRPDIAKLCIKNGYAESVNDAFKKYLIDAYEKTRVFSKGIPYEECIKLILESGGIPVLAHPHTLKLSDKELLIKLKEMIKNGLQGIEVYHSDHTQEQTMKYLEYANKLDLLISGGTDYHGNVKPDIELGHGRHNNVRIKKLSIIDRL